ncbi:MAG: PIN domain-containing protein [Candidatus Omnitrophota bacterium]|nr:PIN domain-containing protein [Candidatus Omnitrophota bacterium]
MSTIGSILVDSAAWYALADKSDALHREATAFLKTHLRENAWLTTHPIVMETWALINRRLGRTAAMTFWERLRSGGVALMPLDAADWEAAWRIALAFPDQDFSLVDCTTFAIMERLGIMQVFTFDDHFLVYRYGARRQQAFIRLPW